MSLLSDILNESACFCFLISFIHDTNDGEMRGFVIIFCDGVGLKLVQYLHLYICSTSFQLVLTRPIKMDFSWNIPERLGGLRGLNENRSKVGNIQNQLTSMLLVRTNLNRVVFNLNL